ncbi:MAG: right-handed parallel beta-helix repeat-containing protein [Candidatus Anammoxibacter sp.]
MARYLDALSQAAGKNGQALVGATLGFFEAGPTSTKLDTFQDEALTITNANPVVADGEGRFPDIFLKPQKYFVEFRDAGGTLKDSQDDVTGPVIGSNSLGNIAEMTALLKSTLLDGDSFPVDGYTTQGDGGGGRLFFNASSTATANDITIFETDEGGTGRWERIIDDLITDLMAGVVGDGAVDDTVRMQAFFDYIVASAANEGTAYLVSDTPKITSTVSVDITNINLGFTIKGDSRVNIKSEVIGAPTFEIQNAIFFKIDGVNFEGNNLTGASGNGHAVALTDTSFGSGTFFPQQADIDNCFITKFRGDDVNDNGGGAIRATGIYISNGLVVHVDRTAVTQCGVGMRFEETQNFSVTRSVVDGCDLYGIHLKNTADGNYISKTDVLNCGRDNGSFSSTVDGLTVPNAGILIEQVNSTVTIEDCKLKNNISNIAATFTQQININGCHLRPEDKTANNGDSGIWTSNCNSINIRDNEILYVSSGSSTYTGIELLSGENSGDFVYNIEGNFFNHADIVDQDILIDGNGSTRALMANIKGNRFGDASRPGNPQTTDCVKIQNASWSGEFTGNLAIAGDTTTTITDVLDIGTGVTLTTDLTIRDNFAKEFLGGTITNPALPTIRATVTSDTTDGSGDITVTHGLIRAPASIVATSGSSAFQSINASTITATTFKLRFRDDTGAAITSTAVTARWTASL